MKKLKAWLENYWYHYKWITIIIFSSVVALSVCLVQCTKKEEPSMYALYAGHYYIGGNESRALSDAISSYTEKDNISVNSFVYISQAKKAEYKENDEYYNEGLNQQQKNDFFEYLYQANFNMMILDPELYSQIKHDEILKPLSEISQKAAEKSSDGYSIRLGDTSLIDKYDIFKEMGEDTVLCFRRQILIQDLSDRHNSEKYSYQLSIFKKMIEE